MRLVAPLWTAYSSAHKFSRQEMRRLQHRNSREVNAARPKQLCATPATLMATSAMPRRSLQSLSAKAMFPKHIDGELSRSL